MKSYTEIRNILEEKYSKQSDVIALITHYMQSDETEKKHYNHAEKYFKELPFAPDVDVKWDVPFPPNKKPAFRFIDLFAGIGGFRIALQELGGKCVFSSEWDTKAGITYERNFGEVPFGDIKEIKSSIIPEHDILLAGFPCQAFSIAGLKGGFEDTRGTLFFEIARIIRDKRPKAFFLENVKGLMSHRKGQTIKRMLEVLRQELGYYVPDPKILNALDFELPQNRERIFIIGFADPKQADLFEYPLPMPRRKVFKDVKEEEPVSARFYLSEQYLLGLEKHRKRHESKGNGFGYKIISDEDHANTIVLGGMGRERNLVIDKRIRDLTPVTNIVGPINKQGIRRMTPREWARLQGFPDKYLIDKVAFVHIYRQIANSVAIPAVQKTAEGILNQLTIGKAETKALIPRQWIRLQDYFRSGYRFAKRFL